MRASSEFELLRKISFAICTEDETEDTILGTGFFFATDGWALTAMHVISKLDPDHIRVLYQGQALTAALFLEAPEQDVAVLFIEGVRVAGHVPLTTRWHANDTILAAGYQQQEYFSGLNPLELQIESYSPLRSVHFRDGREQACLVLRPTDPNYIIQPGTSGGPVLDTRTRSIIGSVIGTMNNQGSFGFAVPFDNLFRNWSDFCDFLNSPFETLASVRKLHAVVEPIEPELKCILKPIPPSTAQPAFEMAACLVTNRQFKEFIESVAYWRPGSGCQRDAMIDRRYLTHWSNGVEDIAQYPVINVSWHAAQAYIAWLSNKLDQPLRLPRQEEWEIAACAGRTWEDCLTEELHPDNVRVNYDFIAGGITPVGAFGHNPYGLYDMLGNVYELCSLEEQGFCARGGSFDSTLYQLSQSLSLEGNECRADVGFRYLHGLRDTKR
jgi:hypothetical protein